MSKFFKVSGYADQFKVTDKGNGIWVSLAGFSQTISAWSPEVREAAAAAAAALAA